MVPNTLVIVFRRALVCAALGLLLGTVPPALGQSSVRGAAVTAPQGAATGKDAATRKDAAAPAQGDETPAAAGKFPNKDTAKNRRDYDMATDTGSIELGRDAESGDTVMRHAPPRPAQQQPQQVDIQPIQVWPVVPGRRPR